MRHDEQQPPRNGVLTVLLAFTGGALLGAVAALLLAPRSGEETRRRIAGAAEDTRDAASRLPRALHEASRAAQAAFATSLEKSA
jgi:gas vesicle protein